MKKALKTTVGRMTRLAALLMFALCGAQSAMAEWWGFKGSATSPSYWNEEANWVISGNTWGNFETTTINNMHINPDPAGSNIFVSGWDKVITFRAKSALAGRLNICAGSVSDPIVFVAEDPEYGITSKNYLNGTASTTSPAPCLEIRSGTYRFTYLDIGTTSGKTTTIVVNGGTLKATSNYTRIGDGGDGVLTVKAGSFDNLEAGNKNMTLGQASGSTGTLNVNGGSATIGGYVALNYNSSAKASAVNITDGGVLTVGYLYLRYAGTDGGTVMIDGGTLKAFGNHDGFLPAHANLNVYVGANGATIDTAGYAITIGEDLVDKTGESGAVKFAGGGIATLTGSIGWTGGTTIEAGTTVKVADGTAATALVGTGVPLTWPEGGVLHPGVCPIVTITGTGEFTDADVAKFAFPAGFVLPDGVTGPTLSEDKKTIYLFVPLSLRDGDGELLQARAQLVFAGATLADLATHTLRARLQGANLDDKGVEATFFDRQETREDGTLVKVTYQLQVLDKGYIKSAKVEFTEGEGGVYAKLVDGNFSNYNGTFSTFGTEPLADNSGKNGYMPYDLRLVEPVSNAISVNFTHTDGSDLDSSSSVRYGGGDYAVPYSDWSNMPAAASGTATIGGATVKVVSSGQYKCVDLAKTKDLRYGYLDDATSDKTVQVTVENVPYEFYRVVAYAATDNADIKFGHMTINGVNYTGETDATVEGTATWGHTGARNKAKGLREGVNYLVSPVECSPTATIVGHRDTASTPTYRGCIAGFQIVEVLPSATYTATIGDGGAKTLSGLSWDVALPATLAADAKVVVNVNEDTTLDIDQALGVMGVEFNVASGKTLTLAGGNVEAMAIGVKGEGKVVAANASQLAGVVKGDGTLVYGAQPTGATFTDSAWTGVLWLKGCAIAGLVPGTAANANSTLRLSGVTGYFNSNPGNSATPQTCAGTLELVNDTYAFALSVDNGWSSNGITVFEKLAGDGTLGVQTRDISQRYVFKDVSEFAGTVNLASRPLRVIFGDGASLSPEDGTITVASGAAATVAAGKTWTANAGGIVVDGTLTLAGATSALSGAVSGTGTVVGSDCLPNNAGLTAAAWTGDVTVNGGATTEAGIAAADATGFMNAGSTFTVATGTVKLFSGAGLTGEVNVLAGATLTVVDESASLVVAVGELAGTLDLSGCAATEISLVGYRSGTVVYPATLETLNFGVPEALADDGVISVPLGNASAATVTATVVDQNGNLKPATVEVSGTTATVTFAPAVSGLACWCDYEMVYKVDSVTGEVLKTGFENTGSDTVPLNSDSGITGENAFYNGMLYTYAHPWRDMKNENAYPGSWTAVVRCTVPAYEDAAVITFGTQGGGLIGLVAGADPETEMRLVQTTGNSHYITNATMTVQDATTAQHVYIFSVETNQTVKVYCDGEMVLDKTFESPFTLGTGIQVGSVHGGVGNTAIVRFAKNEDPAQTLDETVQKNARIDCVRLYKEVLGPNAMAALSVEFPAVKLYRATVADGTTAAWGDLAWTPAWDGGNTASKIILTVEGDAALTLPDSITAEDFTINVADGKTLTLAQAAGGTTMAVGNPVEVNTGSVAFGDASTTLGYAIGGTGTVVVGDGKTVAVAAGGSLKKIAGAGTVEYAALPATAPTFGDWTGTVAIPAVTEGVAGGLNLNAYGVAGSTVRVADVSGSAWLANAEVLPTVEVADGGQVALGAFSATFANTLDALAGSGSFSLLADGTTEGYQDGSFLVKDASGFSGSITLAAPGLAIGASKPATTTRGQLVLSTTATVAATATWTAPGGVVLASPDATLTVVAGGEVTDGTSAIVPTTTVADSYVKTAENIGAVVYSVVPKRTATVTVGEHATVSGIADGQKFVPGDVFTITAGADEYYTVELTVNGVIQRSPCEFTTSDEDLAVSVTATRDTVTVTVPSAENATVSVSYTSGGVAMTATAAGAITVDAGTDVTATWTPADGYRITAGASETLSAVTAAQSLATPTVEARSASVGPASFSFGPDYASATVTATVEGDATTATLTYGGETYTAEVGAGGVVTFKDVVVPARVQPDIYAPAAYTITTDAHATTGGTGSAIPADSTRWFTQDATLQDGGEWTTAIDLSGGPVQVEGNKFTATTASSSDVAVLTFDMSFSAVNADDVEGEAQAAVKLGSDGGASTFMVLTAGGAWTAVSAPGVTPDEDATYRVVITINYLTRKYSVTIDGAALSDGETTQFALASSAESVQDIEFVGAGLLAAMTGDQLEGNMVVDANGNRYATVADAIAAVEAGTATQPLTVLHPGTAPEFWAIENGQLVCTAAAKTVSGDATPVTTYYATLQNAIDATKVATNQGGDPSPAVEPVPVILLADNDEPVVLEKDFKVTITANATPTPYGYNPPTPVDGGDYTIDAAGSGLDGDYTTTYTSRDWLTWTIALVNENGAAVDGVEDGTVVSEKSPEVTFTVTPAEGYDLNGVTAQVAGEAAEALVAVDGTYTYTVAGDVTITVDTAMQPAVAMIGERSYASLAKAVAAAEPGATITLVADDRVTFSGGVYELAIDKALTIDGAGYTLYGVSDYAGGSGDHDVFISGSSDITIRNLTFADFAGAVANNMRTYPIWTGQAYTGTLTLDGVTARNFNRTALNLGGGTVVVTNCTITCDNTKETYFQEGIGVYNANVTIYDTSVTGAGSTLERWPEAACVQLGNPNGANPGTGTITVKGGSFTGDYAAIVASNALNNVAIDGGTFAGKLKVEEGEAGTIVVSGGWFDRQVPADYCADGLEPTTEPDSVTGLYTVKPLVAPVAWPQDWNGGDDAGLLAKFEEWVAAGNSATAPNAEAAFLFGVAAADYEEIAVTAITVADGKVTIDTNQADLTKANGKVYVLCAATPEAFKAGTATKVAVTIGADTSALVNIDGAADAKFFKVGIGYTEP